MSEQDSQKANTDSTAGKKKKTKKAAAKKTVSRQAPAIAEDKPTSPDLSTTVNTAARPGDWTGRLALLLVLAMAAVLVWVIWQRGWWPTDGDAQQQLQTAQASQLEQFQQQLEAVQDQLQQISSQDINATVTPLIDAAEQRSRQLSQTQRQQLDDQLQMLQQTGDRQQDRLRALENRLTDVSSEQQQTQSTLGREQVLQELKLLLRHAHQQLSLNNNSPAAISAYQNAELTLSTADIPGSNALLAALIAERQSIQAIQVPDIDTLISELNGLQQAIPLWPMHGQPDTEDSAEESADQNWRTKLRNSFGQLVTVRKTDQPIISIEQAGLIRQQLSLQLETATLLALQGRQTAFELNLDNARSALQQSFDNDNPGVKAALQTLQSISTTQLTPAWPELNEGLEQLDVLSRRIGASGAAD